MMYWNNIEIENVFKDHWEIAKAFMSRGNGKTNAPEQADAVALITAMNTCKLFVIKDHSCADNLCNHRNALLHSSTNTVGKDFCEQLIADARSFLGDLCYDCIKQLNELKELNDKEVTAEMFDKALEADIQDVLNNISDKMAAGEDVTVLVKRLRDIIEMKRTDELESLEQENERLKHDLQEVQTEKEQLESENKKLQETLHIVEDRNEKLNILLENNKKMIEYLENQRKRLQEELDYIKMPMQDIYSLQSDLIKKVRLIKDIKDLNDDLINIIKGLTNTTDFVKEQMHTQHRRLGENMSSLQEQFSKKQRLIDGMLKRNQESDQYIPNPYEESPEQKRLVNEMKERDKKLTEDANNLLIMLSRQKNCVTDLRRVTVNKELTSHLQGLLYEIAEKERMVEKIKEQNEKITKDIENIQITIDATELPTQRERLQNTNKPDYMENKYTCTVS